MKQKFNCSHCDAFGSISILNDSTEYYEIVVCPSCGAELEHRKDNDEDDE